MAELVSCCFSLYLLLFKNRFILSDLAGRLSSCQVWGHCISWSRGIDNTLNIPSLQMPGCSLLVSGAIQGSRARWKACGGGWGGGQTSGHQVLSVPLLLPRILKGLSPCPQTKQSRNQAVN